MKTRLLLVCILLAAKAFAQLPPQRPLYPNGLGKNPITHPQPESFVDSLVHPKSLTGLNRVYSYVSEPTYMIFPANREQNKHIGLVIYPGGGFRNVWLDKEGSDIALWLSRQGISCMVIKYRTNRRKERGKFEIDMAVYKGAVYQDARTGMTTFKAMADSLGFDKDQVGIMGFSAGGWIAERMTYKYYQGLHEWNPAFVALIYHGSPIKTIKKIKAPQKLPPFFMAVAGNDNRLKVKRVAPYLAKVATDVPQSELHIYRDGGHGFGLAYDENTSVHAWKLDFVNWLCSLQP